MKTWLTFNSEGDGVSIYDPLDVDFDKFELYAGWLLGDADLRRTVSQERQKIRT